MRVLFLESSPVWIYGLPNGFRDAGHEVWISGPLTKTSIPNILSRFKPDLIISIGCTRETTNKRAELIKRFITPLNIPFVYWATEDSPYTNRRFTLPFIKKVKPDYVFTICAEDEDFYKYIKSKAAHMDFAYHESVHHRTSIEMGYKSRIGVVANVYPDLLKSHPQNFRYTTVKTLIKPIIKENIRIDFWGLGWDEIDDFLEFHIPPNCIHGYLPYTEASKVYSSADIVLGILNNTTNITQRIYEILGSEGFVLTYDTKAIRKIFKPRHDLIVSSSPEETIKLIRYYLDKPVEREKIRKKGKITIKNHSYKQRAEYMIKILKEKGILPKNTK